MTQQAAAPPGLAALRARVGERGSTWFRETSGSLADLGVLVPIAVALIVSNGLSATAVLLPAGLAYLLVARTYRLPIAVQPLKAFGAVAIAAGLGSDVIAAGSILMGVTFLLLGSTRLLNVLAGVFPLAVVRGVQLAVGLTFVKIAWNLLAHPPRSFTGTIPTTAIAVAIALALFALLLWKRWAIVAVVGGALTVAVLTSDSAQSLGPSAITMPSFTWSAWTTAAVLLVLPQIPLTLTNSCIAPADASRVYFGDLATRVTPARLARTLGAVNIFAGAISGMPVCHGAGGLSAHVAFGARTWRAPVVIGSVLTASALLFGADLAVVLRAFPLPVLAALLLVAALVHIRLLKDLRLRTDWTLAIMVGVVGVTMNLAWAVAGGLVIWWAVTLVRRRFVTDSRALT